MNNAKDINNINNFNLNLMNTNLFNAKNQQPHENEFVNNKAAKLERRPKEESTSQASKNADNNSKSFAHKPHPNEKQLRIPLNHG